MSIKINLYIFLFVVMFLITNQFEIYSLSMVFALLHELGHLLCGVILGFKVKCLKIMPLGFSVEFYTNIEEYNIKIKKSNLVILKKLLIDFAGPMVNIVFIMISFIFKLTNSIVYSNLIILIVNLIPVYPLDGGRILKNMFKIFLKNRKAEAYVNLISNFFVILISFFFSVAIYYYKNISILFAIIFIWVLILRENKRYNTYMNIYKIIDNSKKYIEK